MIEGKSHNLSPTLKLVVQPDHDQPTLYNVHEHWQIFLVHNKPEPSILAHCSIDGFTQVLGILMLQHRWKP